MQIAIIGGGPAGLRAAEVAAMGGAEVTLFEGKASVGRKFLVAGRGGLNLTHSEPREKFITRYAEPRDLWTALITDFDAEALRAWAAELGVETFAASTGRVYPRTLKGAPLLRRWVQHLRQLGVRFATHHRWCGLQHGERWRLDFEVSGQAQSVAADAVILALGGGSWPETGSDGAWTSILEKLGVAIAPLQPANCGWEVAWPAGIARGRRRAAAKEHPCAGRRSGGPRGIADHAVWAGRRRHLSARAGLARALHTGIGHRSQTRPHRRATGRQARPDPAQFSSPKQSPAGACRRRRRRFSPSALAEPPSLRRSSSPRAPSIA
ncbi:MAG: NAD(P)/FAD-dependent oxidoreductase [Chthoniobacter sp.]